MSSQERQSDTAPSTKAARDASTQKSPRRKIVWRPEQEALLGKLSDWEVAERIGRKLSTVRARREMLHIPPAFLTAKEYPRFVGLRVAHLDPWTPPQDALLGKFSDAEVGRRLNRSSARVYNRRQRLRIPACYPILRLPQVPGMTSKELRKLFSLHGERELCAILRWSIQRVRAVRRQIEALSRARNRPWTEEEERVLGTASDKVVARKLKRTAIAVLHRRVLRGIRVRQPWRAEDDKVVGTRPDPQVAMLLKRRVSNVSWRRRLQGLPPKGVPKLWTPEENGLLGMRPDEELAKQFDRTLQAVVARRCICIPGQAKV